MLSCSEYDVIELVCLFRYPIKLIMKQGDIIEGIAVDTQPNERLKMNVNGIQILVELKDISKLHVCIKNPHFTEVYFN